MARWVSTTSHYEGAVGPDWESFVKHLIKRQWKKTVAPPEWKPSRANFVLKVGPGRGAMISPTYPQIEDAQTSIQIGSNPVWHVMVTFSTDCFLFSSALFDSFGEAKIWAEKQLGVDRRPTAWDRLSEDPV
jgi:hypothetical protein